MSSIRTKLLIAHKNLNEARQELENTPKTDPQTKREIEERIAQIKYVIVLLDKQLLFTNQTY